MINYKDLKDGDNYWTIEEGKPCWSCFDFYSEEIHKENPNTLYFESEKECMEAIKDALEYHSNDCDCDICETLGAN